jgi:DNA-binding response OmpR family regulator
MAEILLVTADPGAPGAVLPALEFLPHRVRTVGLEPSALVDFPKVDLVILDARKDLQSARASAKLLQVTGTAAPVVLTVTEGALTALTAEWGARDFVLANASPGEVEARIRLALATPVTVGADQPVEAIAQGNLVINPVAYTAKLHGQTLDLTYKEFELLRYLAAHPGRVFTRTQLLQEVWGYDYFGGTRTVDVHVRRLRAKLGPENDQLIGTVRNVGYRFDAPKERRRARTGDSAVADALPTADPVPTAKPVRADKSGPPGSVRAVAATSESAPGD